MLNLRPLLSEQVDDGPAIVQIPRRQSASKVACLQIDPVAWHESTVLASPLPVLSSLIVVFDKINWRREFITESYQK